MKKVIILTKKNCQGCNSLKLFLKAALRDKYTENIESITLEENSEEYFDWAKNVETTQVPTLILLEEDEVKQVVRGFNAAAIKDLFESNFD